MIEKNTKQKLFMDYIQTSSLRELLAMVNKHNKDFSDNPILKDDIVQIINNGGDYILLYYK